MLKNSVPLTALLLLTLVACSTGEPSKEYGGVYIETLVTEVKAPPSEIEGLSITSENGHELFNRRAGTIPKGDAIWASGLGAKVPKYFRVVWRKNSGWDDVPVGDPRRIDQYYREDIPASARQNLKWSDGTVAADYTVQVAKRIPPEVGESLRMNPDGTLRIKLKIYPNTRTHPAGVAIGWEIRRHQKDKAGELISELAGGDF